MQDDLRRIFLRGQPVGAGVDEIAPWTTPVKRKATSKHIVDQCLTGLRDLDGTLVNEPIGAVANHRAVLEPFEDNAPTRATENWRSRPSILQGCNR
eukprot:1695153-Pyramimonas_sp.AAC.1